MLALAADENFNNDIIRGVLRRKHDLNFVRAQDAGLSGADDPIVLQWAAQEGRVLFTHDASTMTHHAYERVRTGKRMPGVFEVNREVPIAQAIEDILLLAAGGMQRRRRVGRSSSVLAAAVNKKNGPNVAIGFYNSILLTGRLTQWS